MIEVVTENKNKLGLSVEQASNETSLSKAYLRNEIRAGRLKAKLIGRRVVILETSLRAYLEAGSDWQPMSRRAA